MLRQAINEALHEEMEADPRVFLLGEDVIDPWGGTFRVTAGLSTRFGLERVRETPISEAAIVGCALGAALLGMRPVAEIMFLDFATQAMDQIVNQAAKLRYMTGGQTSVPLVIRVAGGAGRASAAQHSQSLEAWFAHIPGLVVVAPSSPADAKGLLISAIRDDNPVIFLEHKVLYAQKGPVPEEPYAIPLGTAQLKRQGSDVTVVATQLMVQRALAAAADLEREGVSVEVVDPRTLVPLDEETILQSVAKTGRLVIAHEAVKRGGYGAEIAAMVSEQAFDVLDAPIVRVCARAVPMPYNDNLERATIPTPQDIAAAIRSVV
jgi:pyruvate/2-oxoglutarate/acetoin dehydrogenase E1 component